MNMNQKKAHRMRFGLYLALIVLINLVSSTLFFRLDLTRNKAYTLSDMSVKAVSSLEEPLTLRIYLSENLPQPYNNLSRELRDLMEEYSLKSGSKFNYQIYEIDSDGQKTDEKGNLLTTIAGQYGIQPVQIKSYDNNEVSLVSVYMGMVILQNDLSKTINTLGFQSNLEYQITTAIHDLASKTNALLAMKNDINVKLIFSGALRSLGQQYSHYPDDVKSMLDKLNEQYYNRLSFEYIDPASSDKKDLQKYHLNAYQINAPGGGTEKVNAAVVVEKDNSFSSIDLIERTLLGDRIKDAASLEDSIRSVADRLLGVHKTIGYLRDHGAPALYSNPFGQQQGPSLGNFAQLVSKEYQLNPVSLDSLPEGLDTLIIAGVSEPFTDWELYQLDQFLMRGGSLGLFLDPFLEQQPQGQMAYYGGKPTYKPIDTGLRKLLEHYGILMHQSYLMDKKGFVSRTQARNGGFQEVQLPFAPMIDKAAINHDIPFLRNINSLVMLNVAPLEIKKVDGVNTQVLFSSSPKSWEMSDNISLIPQSITAPAEKDMKQYPLSVLIQGNFESYFKDKPVPEAPKKEAKKDETLMIGESGVESRPLAQGDRGKIFLLGSSLVLGDNVIDADGKSMNSIFIMNAVDTLTGNEDMAVMRSKGDAFNPIDSSLTGGFKTFVKGFNIVFLPVLVILAGLIMWFFWIKRKKMIRSMFSGEGEK